MVDLRQKPIFFDNSYGFAEAEAFKPLTGLATEPSGDKSKLSNELSKRLTRTGPSIDQGLAR